MGNVSIRNMRVTGVREIWIKEDGQISLKMNCGTQNLEERAETIKLSGTIYADMVTCRASMEFSGHIGYIQAVGKAYLKKVPDTPQLSFRTWPRKDESHTFYQQRAKRERKKAYILSRMKNLTMTEISLSGEFDRIRLDRTPVKHLLVSLHGTITRLESCGNVGLDGTYGRIDAKGGAVYYEMEDRT